jgi:predicted HicB family RNase H-like nuclease
MKIPVNIRMPQEMKKALDRIAANQFRSLNSLILQFLDDQLKARSINWKKKKDNK